MSERFLLVMHRICLLTKGTLHLSDMDLLLSRVHSNWQAKKAHRTITFDNLTMVTLDYVFHPADVWEVPDP